MKNLTHWTKRLRHVKIISFFNRLAASCKGEAIVRYALSASPLQEAAS
ncbi:hypothetical protein [Rhizobium oryziradicis]|nr:hypothetical protein [Rhizobium oryziradicis]